MSHYNSQNLDGESSNPGYFSDDDWLLETNPALMDYVLNFPAMAIQWATAVEEENAQVPPTLPKKTRRYLRQGRDQRPLAKKRGKRILGSTEMEPNEMEEDEFGFSRNYFLAKELGNSGKKSAPKLSDIDIVDEQELRDAIAKIEQKHEKEIDDLIKSYKGLYQEWVLQLRCGFGVLMYGFGSKRTLIEDFASTALDDYSVVVINGYLQSINLKQLVICLAETLWGVLKIHQSSTAGSSHKPFNTRSIDDLMAFLEGSSLEDSDEFICVLVHNIDGPALRDSETQQYLARIASCSSIRIIASIDHVNALLLWDKKMVHNQFNWYWHHVPTFAPYKVEGTFLPLILAQSGSSQSVKTASIVLQSLTPNAQSVFKVLAEHQIAHTDEEGMPVNNLYGVCRERFLVSSQVTLNSHLTEFKDHELVKTRKDSDGQECLYIPIPSESLEKIMQEISI